MSNDGGFSEIAQLAEDWKQKAETCLAAYHKIEQKLRDLEKVNTFLKKWIKELMDDYS